MTPTPETLPKEATPRPWHVGAVDAGFDIYPEAALPLPEPGADAVATAYRCDDALLIVKAVNDYARLLEVERAAKEVALAIGDRTHGAMASECNEWRERLEQAALRRLAGPGTVLLHRGGGRSTSCA